MRILLATSNPGKIKEIKEILEKYGFQIEVPDRKLKVEETGRTFLENAYLKAKAYYEEFGLPTLADDSGLEVKALNGYPGVYSSRFYSLKEIGGYEDPTPSEDKANLRKLLRLLEGVKDRSARFVACVVVYKGQGGLFAFGECKGTIAEEPAGEGGFGYDPVFIPEGYDRTMAQLSPEEKNAISHRGKALENLIRVLRY